MLASGSVLSRPVAGAQADAAAMLQAADLAQSVAAASLRSQLAQATIMLQDRQTGQPSNSAACSGLSHIMNMLRL